MDDVVVRFAPHQKLPPGYTVQWWESSEHYHWVLSEDVYSDIDGKWACYRGAWAHYRSTASDPTP